MKVTEDQAAELGKLFYPSVATRVVQIALQQFVDAHFPKSPPNMTQWIHCSERLPTNGESCFGGRVATYAGGKRLDWGYAESIRSDMDLWWSAVPKNLVKPTHPDPFQEWMSKNRELIGIAPLEVIAKSAFDAGKSANTSSVCSAKTD